MDKMKFKTATPILVAFILFTNFLYAKGSFKPAIQVDDMIITQYEIDQRLLFFELLKFPGNHKKEAEKSLINDRLKLRAAEKLSVEEGAAFEDIQRARDLKVKEAGEDLILKAKIESSFDQLLMGSLKARQSGNVSYEAVSASKKEKQINQFTNNNFSLQIGRAHV